MDGRAISEKNKALKLPPDKIDFYKTDKTICANRSAITKLPKKLDMLKEVAKYPAETTLPIILQILLEIKADIEASTAGNANNPYQDLKPTLEVIENAITIFGETDRVQRGSLGEKKSYIKKLLDEAKAAGTEPFAELEKLVTEIDKIQITETTKPMWIQLAIFLEGLYKRTGDKVKQRDKNGDPKKGSDGYSTVDAEDLAIWLFVGITKMDISVHYHNAAKKLDEKIESYRPVRRVSQPVAVEAAKPANVVPSEPVANDEVVAAEPVPGDSIDYRMEVGPSATNKKKFTIQIELDEHNMEIGQLLCDTVREMFDNPLAVELKRVQHLNENARIEALHGKLQIYKFSALQKSEFSNFCASAQMVIKKYTDSLAGYNPIKLFGRFPGSSVFEKYHFKEADDAAKDLLNLKEVSDQIIRMIELREAMRGDSSTSFLPDLTELLINISDRICATACVGQVRDVPEPNQSKQVMRII